MGPGDLAQVLRPLVPHTHPNLIIGLAPGDDAAVYLLNETQALVQTLDFFPPIVDDPYTYGAVAAANSMSDVYAMGGEVALALNIVAFPTDLDKSILTAILQGCGSTAPRLAFSAGRASAPAPTSRASGCWATPTRWPRREAFASASTPPPCPS